MVAQSQSTTCPCSLSSQHSLIPTQRAPFVFALLAHLSGTAALTDRKEPFNRITVDDGKETGLSQESTKPVLMGLQLPLQSRAIGQACKQVIVIALDPAGKARKWSPLRANKMPIVTTSLGYSLA